MLKKAVRATVRAWLSWRYATFREVIRDERADEWAALKALLMEWQTDLLERLSLQHEEAVTNITHDYRSDFAEAHSAKRDAARFEQRVRRLLDRLGVAVTEEVLEEDGGEEDQPVRVLDEEPVPDRPVRRKPWQP